LGLGNTALTGRFLSCTSPHQ